MVLGLLEDGPIGDLAQNDPTLGSDYPAGGELGVPAFELPPDERAVQLLAATAVVPDPAKGSKTRSPSRVQATSARRTRRKGFWVGWLPWSFSRREGGGMRQTEPTWAAGSQLFMAS